MNEHDSTSAETPLRTIRFARGWRSARRFANAVGVKYTTYISHEKGRPMSLESAWLYADTLEVSIDEILGRTPFDPNVRTVPLNPIQFAQAPDEEQTDEPAPSEEDCMDSKQQIVDSLDSIDPHGIECLKTIALSLRRTSPSYGFDAKSNGSEVV